MHRLLLSIFHLLFNDTLPDFVPRVNVTHTVTTSGNTLVPISNSSVNVTEDYTPTFNKTNVTTVSVSKVDLNEVNDTQTTKVSDNPTTVDKYEPPSVDNIKLDNGDNQEISDNSIDEYVPPKVINGDMGPNNDIQTIKIKEIVSNNPTIANSYVPSKSILIDERPNNDIQTIIIKEIISNNPTIGWMKRKGIMNLLS